jgi:hypothetical protein
LGFSISCGAYLITKTTTLGGTHDYDLVMVVGGRGTVSEPWKVKSLLTYKSYTVSAMDIVKESYIDNYSREDAEIIYRSYANKVPVEEPKKPSIDLF